MVNGHGPVILSQENSTDHLTHNRDLDQNPTFFDIVYYPPGGYFMPGYNGYTAGAVSLW